MAPLHGLRLKNACEVLEKPIDWISAHGSPQAPDVPAPVTRETPAGVVENGLAEPKADPFQAPEMGVVEHPPVDRQRLNSAELFAFAYEMEQLEREIILLKAQNAALAQEVREVEGEKKVMRDIQRMMGELAL